MRYLLPLILLFSCFTALSADKVYDTKLKRLLTVEQFADLVPPRGQVVMGEEHYQGNIQLAQGTIIRAVVERHFRYDDFSVAWEFLNYTDQSEVFKNYVDYRSKVITPLELFKKWFPNSRSPQANLPYISFVDAAVALGGEVVAVNAPRKHKRVITADGIGALDPDLLPSTYEDGSAQYLERFKVAMGGHVPDSKIKNYFQAQSYTDTIMAHQMQAYSAYDLQFLIVGNFHSDFNDGVVREMTKTHVYETTTVKIVDKATLSSEKFQELINGHLKYGAFADYIFFTNWK